MHNHFLIKKKLSILLAYPMVGNYIQDGMKVGCCALIHAASLLGWNYLNWKSKAPRPQQGTTAKTRPSSNHLGEDTPATWQNESFR